MSNIHLQQMLHVRLQDWEENAQQMDLDVLKENLVKKQELKMLAELTIKVNNVYGIHQLQLVMDIVN